MGENARVGFGEKAAVLAVSGGVDSVVMLDIAMRWGVFDGQRIIVAHFDHGIRETSGRDRELVQKLVEKYLSDGQTRVGVEFVYAEGKLGAGVSEETARKARYDFLFDVAKKNNGKVWTAHHFGDVLETVAINLLRGTGWRGLAVFGNRAVGRFFIDFREKIGEILGGSDGSESGFWGKAEVQEYARAKGLEWNEDETNVDERYLRNRIRRVLAEFSDTAEGGYDELKMKIGELFLWQRELAGEIDEIVEEILGTRQVQERGFEVKWLREQTDEVLMEVFRTQLKKTGHAQTRKGIERLISEVRNYENMPKGQTRAGKKVNLEGGYLVKMGRHVRMDV